LEDTAMTAARIYVPNVQLREHRLRHNLTLEEVAEALISLAWERFAVRVGVNAGMVGKWERGEKRPSRFYQRLFVLLYGVPAEQLGFRPAMPADQADEDLLAELGAGAGASRPFLPDASHGGVGFPVPGVSAPRRVDPQAVGRLGTILSEYAKIDNLLGPAHLLALTSLHLNFISELLTVAAGEARTELLTVGARYAEFTGWLYQDAGNSQAAAYWSDRAMGWAQAADNDLLVSYVLMRKSNQASSAGDASRTLGLARAALRGQDRLSPRARALALRQEARGHALSGDPAGCARALDVAREQVAAAEDHGEEDRILTGYCTPAFIEMEAADCAMLLGQPDQAVVTFQRGLASLPPQYQRDRAVNLARLAVAYAASREPERACAVAQEAAAIVHSTWSARAVAELRRLPTLLSPWQDSDPVVELEATLAALP
jgi:transcriptional regulator with XRE-family HTH domain/tetratricopeptide (TPR) repeat protein